MVQKSTSAKITHSSISNAHQAGTRGTYLNIINTICDKFKANTPYSVVKKLKTFSSKIRKQTYRPLSSLLFNTVFGSPSHSIKKNKRHPNCCCDLHQCSA